MANDDDFDTAWIDQYAARHELDGIDAATIDELLTLAGTAAHSSGDRRNAPLACFLAGLALGLSDVRPSADAVKTLAP